MAATLHCLTGCAIGEILGLALATWWGWSTGPSIALAIGLAFVFGYSFTLVPVLRTGVGVRRAVAIALAADTVSIVTMELVDNAVVLAVPGAMEAALTDALFWGSLFFSLVVAFVVTVPVNRWLIGRGKGHAVVHQLHHGRHADHAERATSGAAAGPHAGH
jgi:C4-dicarboxylate transporter